MTDDSQAVLNAASFNPIKGCHNTSQCDGSGGWLSLMEVPRSVCEPVLPKNPPSPTTGHSLGEAAMAGIIAGSICGTLLIVVLLWIGHKRM